MDFGEVLSKAWKIIWKHKILWLFGILAGCGGANSGGSVNSGYSFSSSSPNLYGSTFPTEVERFFYQAIRFIENIPVWVWILVAAGVIVLALITIGLTTLGRAGLIKGAIQADNGAASLPLGVLVHDSLPYFWRILLLNLLFGVALFILVLSMVVAITLIGVLTLGIGLICLIPFICLIVPIGWFINVLIEQSSVAIIAEDRGVFSSISRGWNVIIKNPGNMIIMSLIITLGGGLISLVLGLPFVLVILPPMIGLFSGTLQGLQVSLVVAGVLFLCLLPFLLVGGGILRSYTGSAWVLTYLRLTAPRAGISAVPLSPEPFVPASAQPERSETLPTESPSGSSDSPDF